MLRRAAGLLIAASVLGCRGPSTGSPNTSPVVLSGTLDPLRRDFDAQRGRPRAILLLSPT